jgi:hypothetical protein
MIRKKKTLLLLFLVISIFCSGQQNEVQYLSGKDKDNRIDWEFFCTGGRNSGVWTSIPVPSCWELEGFGEYHYGRNKQKPEPADVEQGFYRHTFTVSEDWEGKTVYLVFEGVMTDAEVKINGSLAGPVHQGAFYEFKYDITSLLSFDKENVLEVNVKKYSDNESVNDAERRADYWIFGGIFRPVYLKAKPKEHIDYFAVDAKADGSFICHVFPVSINTASQVTINLFDMNGNSVGQEIRAPILSDSVVVAGKFNDITPWNPENPVRYKVHISLENDNHILHEKQDIIGFRTVDIIPKDGIYVNGVKVFLKGVNRHSFWPSSGRTTSKDLSIKDILLIKEMNMNAVRMSHYPPDKHFLYACDSLGLFVLNELAGWQAAYDTKTGKKLVKEMVVRDVNHPSIIIWNNGNETGWNDSLDAYFYKYDVQDRTVLHPYSLHNDIATYHYKTWDCCEDIMFGGNDIFMPTEFLHGVFDGGSGAGLDDFYNKMLQNPLAAGGFLWVFADEGIVRTDMDGWIDVDGHHAPDGIVGPYREKEGSFFTIKEIYSPVHVPQLHLTPQFRGNIPIENRFLYTPFDSCTFHVSLSKTSGPRHKGIEMTETKAIDVTVPKLKPGEKGEAILSLPKNWTTYDILSFTAYDQNERELYTWTWPVKTPEQITHQFTSHALRKEGKIQHEEKEGILDISAGDVSLQFDKATGLLMKVSNKNGILPISNGPSLIDPSLEGLTDFSYKKEKGKLVITLTYKTRVSYEARWTIYPDGLALFDYEFDLGSGSFDFIGFNFDLPEEEVKSFKYLGRGPYRVWKNRKKGGAFGVWEKEYNNTITGENWEYPEFKGYHKDFYWTEIHLKNNRFRVYNNSQESTMYLRILTPEKPSVKMWHDYIAPKMPEGDISFLHGISAIGTKFHSAERISPSGKPNIVSSGDLAPVPFLGSILFDFKGN